MGYCVHYQLVSIMLALVYCTVGLNADVWIVDKNVFYNLLVKSSIIGDDMLMWFRLRV